MNHPVTILFHYTDVLVSQTLCYNYSDLDLTFAVDWSFSISGNFHQIILPTKYRLFASKSRSDIPAASQKALYNLTCGSNQL